MRPDDFLNLFTLKLKELGPNAALLSEEMQQQLKSAALATFQKLDLVTREEFDAQQAVLIRTREKLDALEAEVANLSQELAKKA